MTIASGVQTEEELDGHEQQHICPEMILADLLTRETRVEPKLRPNPVQSPHHPQLN
jgi:hypothetical protein